MSFLKEAGNVVRRRRIIIGCMAIGIAVVLSLVPTIRSDFFDRRLGPWTPPPAITIQTPEVRISVYTCIMMGAAWGGSHYRGFPFAVYEESHASDPCVIGASKYFYPAAVILNLGLGALVVTGCWQGISLIIRRKKYDQ